MSTWRSQSSPTRSKANCTNSRTVWDSPVAITKSSGSSRWSIIHIASTYSGAWPQSRSASRLPRYSLSCMPALIRATAREILRVTNVFPRMIDAWLNKIPLQANRSYASRYFTVDQYANTLETRYGLRGWNGVDSLCGGGAEPYISEDD